MVICYEINMANGVAELPVWSKIWKAQIHERLKVFIWRLCAGDLPTNDTLYRRLGGEEPLCAICVMALESSLHLFNECFGLRALAFGSEWGGKIEAWRAGFIVKLVEVCLNPTPLIWDGFKDKKKSARFFLLTFCMFSGVTEMIRFLVMVSIL